MITIEQIDSSKKKISELIAKQLKEGEQSKKFSAADKIFACGQFLNKNDRSQRGVHGSASSLRVLSDFDSGQNKELIEGLTKYLTERVAIEAGIANEIDRVNHHRIERDNNNNIKLSETLYALNFVKAGVAETEAFKQILSRKLIDACIRQNEGWDFFIDSNNPEVQIIPTAFACFALNKNGNSVNGQIEKLKTKLETSKITDPVIFAEVVLGLYTLVFLKDDIDKTDLKKYKGLLKKLWQSPYCTLDSDYEQNIEYWHHTEHDYIRIPWQMYIIAIASKISPWYFATKLSQERLKSILNSYDSDGFKYPHSGSYISTRTNAIAYEMLTFTKKNINRRFLYPVLNFFDKTRIFIGGKWVRYTLASLALIFMGYSIYRFWIDYQLGKAHIGDIAPEFIGNIVILMFMLGKRK